MHQLNNRMRQKHVPGMTTQTASLTQFIAQVFHITNTIPSGQTSAYETNMKQVCHGPGELGFSPKSQVRRRKSKCFVLSSTYFSDERQQEKHIGIQRRSQAQILTEGHRVLAPSYTWTTDNPSVVRHSLLATLLSITHLFRVICFIEVPFCKSFLTPPRFIYIPRKKNVSF